MSENNGYAIRGTLNMLLLGRTTLEHTTEIINMWVEQTAKKSYAEGELDGRRNNKKSEKEWQTISDMGM